MAFDRGNIIELEKKLEETPDDLNELFEGILNRDGHDLNRMRLCVQWILFAKRPLTRVELYFAILSSTSEECPLYSDELTAESMDTFILSCSKGLAEPTRGKNPTFQFIHETVRDFFLKGKGMQYIHATQVLSPIGLGHNNLKNCCMQYIVLNQRMLEAATGTINFNDFSTYNKKTLFLLNTRHRDHISMMERWNQAIKQLPFLEYALLNLLPHADSAEFDNFSQLDFLRTFQIRPWMYWRNIIQVMKALLTYDCVPKDSKFLLLADSNMLSISTVLNLKSLVRAMLEMGTGIDVQGGQYGTPLRAALTLMHRETLTTILTPNRGRETVEYPGPSISEIDGLIATYHYFYEQVTPTASLLEAFYRWGFESDIITLLQSRRFDLNAKVSAIIPYTPLSIAADRGYERLASFLIEEEDVDFNIPDQQGITPLAKASQQGRLNIVSLLLQSPKVTDVNIPSSAGRSPLSYAAEYGHEHVVRFLLNQPNIQVNSRDCKGRTPFFYAAQCGREPIVKLLLDVPDIDVVSRDNMNYTALSHAVLLGHKGVVWELLKSEKIDINSQDSVHGRTPLLLAIAHNYESIARALLNYPGIDVSLCDKRGQNASDWINCRGLQY